VKKQTLVTALLSILLISALSGTMFQVFAATPSDDLPTVTIIHPMAGAVFGNSSIFLEFDVKPPANYRYAEHFIHEIYYIIDEGAWNLVYQSAQLTFPLPEPEILYAGVTRLQEFHSNLTITGVEDGVHRIRVTASFIGIGPYLDGSSPMVGFTVDITQPRVSILSPKEVTYNTSWMPLLFTLNEHVSQMSYCLDDKENFTLTNNATLTGLQNGRHSLVIYAWDEAGNVGKSEARTFDVLTSEPFPTTFAVAVLASAVAVGAGLLLYFKKSKR
jgi:hypothetical protein